MSLCLIKITFFFFFFYYFFFNDTATTEIYTLSLHDALPIYIKKFCNQCIQVKDNEIETYDLSGSDYFSSDGTKVRSRLKLGQSQIICSNVCFKINQPSDLDTLMPLITELNKKILIITRHLKPDIRPFMKEFDSSKDNPIFEYDKKLNNI